MPNDGSGEGWDETAPLPGGPLPQGDDEIRDLRKGMRIRLEKEHVEPDVSSVGGEHKAGSAMVYVVANEAALPTTRPDGVTVFTNADVGRLALALDTVLPYYLKDTSGTGVGPWSWVKLNANSVVAQTAEKYVLLRHEKAEGANAGNVTGGGWRNRIINTEVCDAGTVAALTTADVTNTDFTLAAGTYRMHIVVPGYNVGGLQARLFNVTDDVVQPLVVPSGSNYAYSASGRAGLAVGVNIHVVVVGRFTIASTKTFRIQAFYEATATDGGGKAAVGLSSPGQVEVYTVAEFWREVA